MTETDGERWAAWLRAQFDRPSSPVRKNADLVARSGEKPNGRPRIDASRVTKWLQGSRPSFELAVLTAEIFGVPTREVLLAAGYDAGLAEPALSGSGTLTVRPDLEDAPYLQRQTTGGHRVYLDEATGDDLLAELARRMADERDQ